LRDEDLRKRAKSKCTEKLYFVFKEKSLIDFPALVCKFFLPIEISIESLLEKIASILAADHPGDPVSCGASSKDHDPVKLTHINDQVTSCNLTEN
jgi:hypothetical protein